jgi:hypothetical protein
MSEIQHYPDCDLDGCEHDDRAENAHARIDPYHAQWCADCHSWGTHDADGCSVTKVERLLRDHGHVDPLR